VPTVQLRIGEHSLSNGRKPFHQNRFRGRSTLPRSAHRLISRLALTLSFCMLCRATNLSPRFSEQWRRPPYPLDSSNYEDMEKSVHVLEKSPQESTCTLSYSINVIIMLEKSQYFDKNRVCRPDPELGGHVILTHAVGDRLSYRPDQERDFDQIVRYCVHSDIGEIFGRGDRSGTFR
jgi:hypothetical protein